MVPESLATVVVFLLLITPGFVFASLQRRRTPIAERSAFEETNAVIVGSLVFSGAALVIFSLLRGLLHPDWIPDPGRWIREGSAYAKERYRVVALFLVLQTGVAVLLAWIADLILRSDGKNADIDPNASAWYKMLGERPRKAGKIPWAEVALKEGPEYRGCVSAYTTDLGSPDDRELLLIPTNGKPLGIRHAGGDWQDLDGWDGVLLAGSQIETITVALISVATTS